MSRYIKSAETLKARVGKQVKVDGTLCDVTERRGLIVFEAVDGRYHAEVDNIESFLLVHNVASAGYKFKHTSKVIKDFILNKECRITLKPYVGTFDNESSNHTVVGMLMFCKDHCGDRGYMLLTNDEHLRGDPAEDMKRYDWSWWLGFDEKALKEHIERTEPLESECNCVTQSGTEKTEEKEYSLLKLMGEEDTRKTVKGIIKEYRGISYLLSNDDTFDGGHPDAVKGTDYKYGWWLCEGSDISKSGYAIREACAESEENHIEGTDFITDKECWIDVQPECGEWPGLIQTIRGMLVHVKGDGWYLLSNERQLNGAPVTDRKGYKYSWRIGSDLQDQSKVIMTSEEEPHKGFKSDSEDPLVRIAKALERIAVSLEK